MANMIPPPWGRTEAEVVDDLLMNLSIINANGQTIPHDTPLVHVL
jgi:hypothetical protein